MQFKTLAASAVAISIAGQIVASPAFAWGDTGHRLIGEAAMRALPKGLPAFLYTAQSAVDVGQYSREPDMWRKAGAVHDSDRDPAHLMELDDNGLSAAGTPLDAMPATRTLYEAAVRAHGGDPVTAGYSYYSIIDAYQQVCKDFAFLRVIALGEAKEKDKAKLAWLKNAERRRQDLTLRDIGILSHYVGDATQPMHMSIHYNGWGNYPNPNGYTTASIHWPLEAEYVRQNVTAKDLVLSAPVSCTDKAEVCVAARLKADFTQVIPLYALEKAGGFKTGDPRGKAFMAGRIAQGASDVRDMVGNAWMASTKTPVNFAGATYDDAKAGKIADLYILLAGDS